MLSLWRMLRRGTGHESSQPVLAICEAGNDEVGQGSEENRLRLHGQRTGLRRSHLLRDTPCAHAHVLAVDNATGCVESGFCAPRILDKSMGDFRTVWDRSI